MSCSWHIQCVVCDEQLHFDNSNHAEAAMHELIRMAPHLKGMPRGLCVRLNGDNYLSEDIDYAWLGAHSGPGHQLIPIDEYGSLATQCHGRVSCSCCGHSGNCTRPLNHQGPHLR